MKDIKKIGNYFENRKDTWVCVDCMCGDLELENINAAEVVRELGEKFGYMFETSESGQKRKHIFIPRCCTKRTHYKFIGFGDCKKTRIQFDTETKKRLKRLYNNTDAFSGQKSGDLQIDHKTPHLIKDDEKPYALMSDDELMDEFQLLTPGHNTQKREVCSYCQNSGRRPPFFFSGCAGYYAGDSQYNGTCYGCGWYDGNAWREANANDGIKKDKLIYDYIKKSKTGIKSIVNFEDWKKFLEEFPELKSKNIPEHIEEGGNINTSLW